MSDEELQREARKYGREILPDAELNRIINAMTDSYFDKCLQNEAALLPTKLYCYHSSIKDGTRNVTVVEIDDSIRLEKEPLEKLGSMLFNSGIMPAAIFIVGYGEFRIERHGENQRDGKGVVLAGVTPDGRSVNSHVECVRGETRSHPIDKVVIEFDEDRKGKRFNFLVWVYDGYKSEMDAAVLSETLASNINQLGLWKPGAWKV